MGGQTAAPLRTAPVPGGSSTAGHKSERKITGGEPFLQIRSADHAAENERFSESAPFHIPLPVRRMERPNGAPPARSAARRSIPGMVPGIIRGLSGGFPKDPETRRWIKMESSASVRMKRAAGDYN